MNYLARLISKLAHALNDLIGNLTEAASEGVAPKENIYAVDANVEWGRQWILVAVDTLLRGGRIHVTTIDLVMLLIFVASAVLHRRMKATSVTMAGGGLATNG